MTPNVTALTSPGVHVVPHRSVALPYSASASVVGHIPAAALSSPVGVLPVFVSRTVASTTAELEHLRPTFTVMPTMVASLGTANP